MADPVDRLDLLQAREERRLVTVLFADVVGSTSLGESLDPEDVRALLARLFAIARDAVERHGGLVEKYIGDAVMAIFGLPVAHDDDAARALSAALDLRDRVQADAVLGASLQIRLGVNSGEVIATRDEHDHGPIVVGDAVNTAARLEQGAEPWEILVGARTVRATDSRFAFGPPMELAAKGKAQPVVARQLEGLLPEPHGSRARHKIVGRNADLLQLQLVARRTVEERRPYLVSVVAPAGVGKSRLLEEFLDRLAGEDEEAPLVALAQCLPYGQRLTFWPLRAIALAILGVPDSTPPDRLRDALAGWLESAGEPDPAATAELLAATLGAGETDAGDRIALHGAWRRFVELAARQRPVVLVIEDLHWSSDSLLDLVEAMLAPHGDVPLLMVALARPELLDRRPAWGGGRRNAVSIALDPLPERALSEVVGDLLEVPDASLVEAVVARAEGNPFYAGEIVRSVLDLLGDRPSADAVPAAIAALPDSVQATVLARLDTLDPAARRTVQVAAVVGRSFPAAALGALEPAIGGAALGDAIGALLERDFVRSDGTDRYTFRHILIREVAYGTLPRAERARLHALAGAWLAGEARRSGREDELAELVAFHLREAATLRAASGEGVDPGLARDAVEWLERAAAAAAAGAATTEAARHLEAAASLAEPARRAAIAERLGQVWVVGDQALEAFDRAYRLGIEAGLGPDQALRTLSQYGLVLGRWLGSLTVRGSSDALREVADRIVALRRADGEARALALSYLAESFLETAGRHGPIDWQLATRRAEQALAYAEDIEDRDLASAALDALNAAAQSADAYEAALRHSLRRLEIAGLATEERFDAQSMVAWARMCLGDLEGAEAAASDVQADLGPGQAPTWRLGAGAWRVSALHGLGRWDEALAEAERALVAWRESEVTSPGYALHGFVDAWRIVDARRDAPGADRWASVVRSITRRVSEIDRRRAYDHIVDRRIPEIWAAYVENGLTYSGRLDLVGSALGDLADLRATGPAEPVALILERAVDRKAALTAAQAGRWIGIATGEAAPLRSALDRFETAGAVPYIARVRTELGILTGDAALIDDGMAILERLGDQRQLERVARERLDGRFGGPYLD